MVNIDLSMPSWYVWNLTWTDTHRQRERVTESVCERGRNPLVVFFTSPLRNYLTFWKIFVFLLSGQTKEIILMMPEPQMTPQIIMIPMQVAQWNLQIHPHHWSRRHHKWCSCEPCSTQLWHSTLVLHELHLSGQGTEHSRVCRWRTAHWPSHPHIPLLIISWYFNFQDSSKYISKYFKDISISL